MTDQAALALLCALPDDEARLSWLESISDLGTYVAADLSQRSLSGRDLCVALLQQMQEHRALDAWFYSTLRAESRAMLCAAK